MRAVFAAVGLWVASATVGLAACSQDTLTVWGGASPKARFSVEVVDTAQTRGQGLMGREELARSAGMLFVYDQPQFVAFWMRNTLIPLDMIFADASGTVRKIHANAVPLDETAIPGGDGIQFVFEINGGLAARLGLDAGDHLQHPAIPGETAAVPCP